LSPDPACGVVIDQVFEEHDTGPGHPERAARLSRLRAALDASGLLERCRRLPIERATDEMLERVHARGYVARIEQACRDGAPMVDSMDVAICPESARIARLAAGSLVGLCREVADGRLRRGFAAMRPPGHHAERDLAMGFCLFNNVAVAAADLRARGLDRVLIVDWDVHHGNGTQHIFEEDPSVFYFSLHQSPLYPGTGAAEETGRGAGRGATLNCPLPPGAGDDAFLGALRDRLGPAVESFRPDMILISAGFDAHAADPLANLTVSTEAYGEATRLLRKMADEACRGRLVSLLEGGYDLEALAASATLHLQEMLAD
jgi:acetoin utilization deacetylase AcuC-like enzyme